MSLTSVLSTAGLGVALGKANTLIEALPWLARFHGSVVVIKYGGHAMLDAELQRAFAADLVFLRYVGLKPVVVHGGGPQISSMLDRLGIDQRLEHQGQPFADDVQVTASAQCIQQLGQGRLAEGHRGELLGVHPGRNTLSFTRWPLALLIRRWACPQSPPPPGTPTDTTVRLLDSTRILALS